MNIKGIYIHHSMTRLQTQSYFCCCHQLLSSLSDGLFENATSELESQLLQGVCGGLFMQNLFFYLYESVTLKPENCSVTVL